MNGPGLEEKATSAPRLVLQDVQSAVAGSSHAVVLKNEGRVYTWHDHEPVAVEEPPWEGVSRIAAGASCTLVIDTLGQLYMTGEIGSLSSDDDEFVQVNEPPPPSF